MVEALDWRVGALLRRAAAEVVVLRIWMGVVCWQRERRERGVGGRPLLWRRAAAAAATAHDGRPNRAARKRETETHASHTLLDGTERLQVGVTYGSGVHI
jgi:hypothetical protein